MRLDWRGVVCDPCVIICLVMGYSGWRGVTDTQQDHFPPSAGSQVVNNGGGDFGGGGVRGVLKGSMRSSQCWCRRSSGSESGVCQPDVEHF